VDVRTPLEMEGGRFSGLAEPYSDSMPSARYVAMDDGVPSGLVSRYWIMGIGMATTWLSAFGGSPPRALTDLNWL